MLYPLRFQPIYKEMVWGGQKMADMYNRTLPYAHTGESWDISCRDGEMGIVENGPLAGQRFIDVINTDREAYLGTALAGAGRSKSEQQDLEPLTHATGEGAQLASFPLLVKIIDAMDNLSVQVHPDDLYAMANENYPQGKNEMWYVLEAPEDGALVIGLKDGVGREDFLEAVNSNTVESCLNYLPVRLGDVLDIPAGLVHALTKGVMVAEIQQNSDITYRIYDYNRIGLNGKMRELHLEKALDVADFDGKISKQAVPGLTVRKGENIYQYYIANEYFSVILYEVNEPLAERMEGDRFCIFTCVSGSVSLIGGGETVELSAGGSAFVPAGLGLLSIEGCGRLLKSVVPDIRRDFIGPLLDAGYELSEIRNNTAVDC